MYFFFLEKYGVRSYGRIEIAIYTVRTNRFRFFIQPRAFAVKITDDLTPLPQLRETPITIGKPHASPVSAVSRYRTRELAWENSTIRGKTKISSVSRSQTYDVGGGERRAAQPVRWRIIRLLLISLL